KGARRARRGADARLDHQRRRRNRRGGLGRDRTEDGIGRGEGHRPRPEAAKSAFQQPQRKDALRMQAGLRLRPEGQEYIGFARNNRTMSPARASTAVDTAEGAIVFTDLAGFTEFTAIQGDEAALDLLGVQDQVVGGLIEGRGRVVKELGDGLMLWFDDPCHAIETALELQERFDDQSTKENLPLW